MVSDRKALAFVRRLASLAILSLLAVSTTVQAAPGEGALSRDLREGRAAGQSTFRFIFQGSKAILCQIEGLCRIAQVGVGQFVGQRVRVARIRQERLLRQRRVLDVL